VKSHAAVAAVLLEQETDGAESGYGERLVDGVIRDLESSELPEREKVLLRFIEKVNHHSPEITAEDTRAVRDAGWTDEQLYYAITVCALFNFYNRWIDATGVHALSDEAHRQGGIRSSKAGYVRK
jgi:hypothetical protein